MSRRRQARLLCEGRSSHGGGEVWPEGQACLGDRETEARELMLLAVALAASWWDIPSKVGERSFDEIVRKERWASPGNLPD